MQSSFDRDGWWEVCQSLRPDMTREEFDSSWDEFQIEKEQRAQLKASLRIIHNGEEQVS